MKLKKLSAFLVVLILIFCAIAGVAVYGATTVTLSLTSIEAYRPYEYYIPLDKVGLNDGDTYTFKRPDRQVDKCDPGIWPSGLDVDEDGRIHGIPQSSSSYRKMNILAVSNTDSSKRITIKCSLQVKARKVNIVVTGGTFPYDGQEHTASAKVFDALTDEEIEGAIPTIQYGTDSSLTAVTEAGSYKLKVLAPSGCSLNSASGDGSITITALDAPELDVDNKSFPYDGEGHGITEEDIHIDSSYIGDYIVEYKHFYQSDDDYTEELPVEEGTYTVRVRTTNKNYRTAIATASISIYKDKINFTVKNNSKIYNNNEQEPDVEPSKADVGFSCVYIDEEGKEIEGKPRNAGTYTIKIILEDTYSYSVGTISDTRFTITPLPIVFTANNNVWEYDREEHRLDITTEPEIESDYYSVGYIKRGGDGTVLDAIHEAGEYDVEFSFNTPNYVVQTEGSINSAEITQAVVDFIINPAEYEYDGERYNPTVIASVDHIGQVFHSYVNSLGHQQVSVQDADTYIVELAISDSGYKVGKIEPDTITVRPKPIKFTAENEVLDYTGEELNPVITADSGLDSDLYTITYTKQGGDGTELTSVRLPGTYDVHVNFVKSEYSGKSNYIQTEDSVKTVEVIAPPFDVHIMGGEYTYDGQPHYASAIPEEAVTLTYKKDGIAVEHPTDAGTYDIEVTANDGFTIGEVTGDSQFVIKPKEIKFIAEHTLFDYDEKNGEDFNPNITPLELPESVTYEVKYRKRSDGTEVTKITDEGRYDVLVTINDSNYIPELPLPIITVSSDASVVVIIQTGTYIYNGSVQTPLVEPDEAINVVYKDAAGAIVADPIDAGEYTIEVTAKEDYMINRIIGDTHFVIQPAEITFEVFPNVFLYDGETEHTPIVASNNLPEEITYSVQYQNEEGELSDTVKDAGEYSVIVQLSSETISSDLLNNNYRAVAKPDKVFVVRADGTVTVVGGEYTYDGEPHYAEVTPSGGVTVTYTKDGEEVTDPTDAGEYTINVTSTMEGYNPTITGDTTLTINKKNITFDVSDTNYTYDGQPHTVTVTPSSDNVTADMYSVVYTKDGAEITDPTSVGKYTFTVEKTDNWNENFVFNPCTGTLTITNHTMVYGNSPAAMIFKDETHDDEWKQNAFEYFKQNHKFDENYCPADCIAEVEYNPVYGIDFDTDLSTVIVKDINDFTEPGIQKDGQAVTDYTKVQEKVNNDDNFYKITYTVGTDDEQEEIVRYVVVIKKTGDTNGDGNVNAVDANYLNANGGWDTDDGREVISITDARVWDVNHNNLIDKADAAAIRNRFSNKIISYYPWIIN